jgi:hypothetical protein
MRWNLTTRRGQVKRVLALIELYSRGYNDRNTLAH